MARARTPFPSIPPGINPRNRNVDRMGTRRPLERSIKSDKLPSLKVSCENDSRVNWSWNDLSTFRESFENVWKRLFHRFSNVMRFLAESIK